MHMAILVIENHFIKYQDDPPPKEEVKEGAEVKKRRKQRLLGGYISQQIRVINELGWQLTTADLNY